MEMFADMTRSLQFCKGFANSHVGFVNKFATRDLIGCSIYIRIFEGEVESGQVEGAEHIDCAGAGDSSCHVGDGATADVPSCIVDTLVEQQG